MIPGDRLFCVFTESLPVGYEFKNWPLHVTIVPWFRVKEVSEQLAQRLSSGLSDLSPFEAVAGEETIMGARRRTANLIRTPSPLEMIQQRARSLLHDLNAWIVDETTKKHRGFIPHVTAQESARLHKGDKFLCDSVCIIEQKGGYKTIESRIQL